MCPVLAINQSLWQHSNSLLMVHVAILMAEFLSSLGLPITRYADDSSETVKTFKLDEHLWVD